MPNKIAQFNVRLPKETVHAITVIAAMLDVPVQQLGADAIAIYYGKADEETLERRRVALAAAKRIFPDGGFGVSDDAEPKQPSVKELRLPLRQSPQTAATLSPASAIATAKEAPKALRVSADAFGDARIVALPELSFFRSTATPVPIAA